MGNIGSTSTLSSNETNIEKEVQDYLSEVSLPEDSDPLLYWQTKSSAMPTLGTLAKKYLTIPATSASMERLFSVAGRICRPDRCRLSDKQFERLLFIKTNAHLKV